MPGSDRDLNHAGSDQRKIIVAITSLTLEEFVRHLRRFDVDIQAKDGKLLLNAPAGALTVELQEELRRRKAELLTWLIMRDDAGEERIAPLTFAQQRLWLIDKFSPGSVAYNIPQSWIVESDVDLDALRHALDRLAERHPALRTRIESRHGETVQIVMKRVDIPLAFTDLTTETDRQDREMRVQALLVEDGRQVFAMDHAPLIRFHVLRLAANRHLISYNLHHIMVDQWSLDVLKRDLAVLYTEILTGRTSTLPVLSLQYADVAERERSETTARLHTRQLEYWRERLRAMPTLLELPFSKTRPAKQTDAGATLSVALGTALTQQLRQLASHNNTSLYLLMFSVFATLLYRYTGQKDLCVGTPITGRRFREEEDVIGLFVNMLPLRCTLDPAESFHHLLKQVNDAVLTDFEYSEVPFQKLVMELHPHRSSSHSPLFQIMFALNARGTDADGAQRETFIGVSKFDLTLQIAERSHTMDAYFEYRTDLFAQKDMEQFSRHFICLAESVVKAPESEVRYLALLTAEDMNACERWNATEFAFDSSDTLISLFERQVRLHPDAVALCHEETTYSFRALNERASRLAAWLCAKGAKPGNFVALCLDRSPELIVSMLGILKTGAAYLPLDPKYPEERLAYMLNDSGAIILITMRNDLSARLAIDHPDLTVRFAEDDLPALECSKNFANAWSNASAKPIDAAYLIYTSGSTGKPKGVVVEHRNAVALIAWARNYFDAESLQCVLASTSICFDLSVFEIFLPLCTGNTIVLIDDLLQLPTSPFAEKVTLVNTVPSAMSALLHAGLPSNVRTVCMAGEFLPTELVDRVYAIRVRQVFDLYGPTETTTYSTCTLRLHGAPATIGTPIANTRIYLLDDNKSQVPPGTMGEIFIGGAGVARGYLDRPELTEERFVSIPEIEPVGRLYRTGDLARQRSDGELVYLGRRDRQIKLRGHRIELGEIEAALREVSGASQLAVVVQKREAGDILVAFLVRDEVRLIEPKEWIAALRNRLPAYMIPTLIFPLAAMPLTPNGKIDRTALSLLQKAVADESEGSDFREAPRDLLEQWVANIWAHRLGLKYIARKAHFFEDLGGHSLVAFEIFTEIETRIGVAMMLATLLQAPTVELLSTAIQRHGWRAPDHLAFVSSGSDTKVIYLVGKAVEAQIEGLRASGERIMSIEYANGIAKQDAWAEEIAALEATQPPLVLIGSNSASEDIRKLAAALISAGFANVAMRFLELR